jgi:hypothetical protein
MDAEIKYSLISSLGGLDSRLLKISGLLVNWMVFIMEVKEILPNLRRESKLRLQEAPSLWRNREKEK